LTFCGALICFLSRRISATFSSSLRNLQNKKWKNDMPMIRSGLDSLDQEMNSRTGYAGMRAVQCEKVGGKVWNLTIL
jgi:hypothetical protein